MDHRIGHGVTWQVVQPIRRVTNILALAGLVFLIFAPQVQAAPEPEIEWFFQTMVEKLDEVEHVLRASESDTAKL